MSRQHLAEVLDVKMTDPAFRLFCVMDALAVDGTVTVSGAQLASVLQKTEGAVWRAMDELRRHGHVTRERNHPRAMLGASANTYTLHYQTWDHA